MANEITLPVKLLIENLLSIVKDMKEQLSSLKVDSTGYRNLSKVILDIEKRIESLLVLSSRPFVNAKLFTDVEKEISHILDDLTKIGLEAGKIKFSDLLLDASLKAKLLEFDSLIKSLNDLLKNMKENAKNAFLETDVGKMWKDSHREAATQSFSEITKAINKEVLNLLKALELAELAYKDYKNTIAASNSINTFMSKKQGHLLSEVSMGKELYNLIFSGEGDKLRFKNGGRSLLQEWLELQFKFDSSTAQKLVSGTAKEVKAAFEQVLGEVENTLKQQKIRLGERADEARTQSNNGKTYTQDITEKNAHMQALLLALNGVVLTTMAMRKSELELQNLLENAKGAREQYTLSLVSGARGYLTMGEASSAAKQLLASLQLTVDIGKQKLANLDKSVSKLQGISNFVNRYVGAYAIIRKISTAIRNAFTNIKELDKVITNIAVVTNMSQSDLWNKVGEYTQIAQQYGVMTKDVYTVSQLFYQQGLLTSLVMELTTETLKMAKIAGMDYTAATNAMTVAVRAFNIEMSEAQQVTDTYSALAAKFAVSSAEIANAMEKTASSAASVGMSLQSTSAFISVMEQTTRESAQNIGSALKSIISRYGEMKASPDKLLNVEGEDVAFNKTDTALKSIGISIKDVNGQFRDFDDVIMELASKWNTLDNNTLRYIATIMAGNRQQSRFIALVSNYDELKRAMTTANDSENASIVQVGKTLDSLESKTNLLKNAWQQLYLSLHIENGLKGTYDMLTRILQTIGKLGMKNGVLPTLMNLVGFGTGLKSLVRIGQDAINTRKSKINLDTTEAENKIKIINEEIEKQRTMPITTKVDDTELKNVELRVLALNVTTTTVGPTGSTMPISDNQFYSILHNAYLNGSLLTLIGRALTLLEMGVLPGTEKYTEMDKLMTTFDGLLPSVEALKTAFDATTGSVTAHTAAETVDSTAILTHSIALDSNTNAIEMNNAAITGETNAHVLAGEGTALMALSAADATLALSGASPALLTAGTSLMNLEGNIDRTAVSTQLLATSNLENSNQTNNSSNRLMIFISKIIETVRNLLNFDSALNKTSGTLAGTNGLTSVATRTGWFNSSNSGLMKGIGIGSSLSRLGGTALAAAGAAHEDKSTDTGLFGLGVENSKILTGLGNGLSMAGTGASIGMAAGPWGAVIGAVAGFVIGGLGAIIDGVHMSLYERLELEKQEAKKAADEALKSKAKSTDVSVQLDNIKSLRKAMYDSTEDMLKYTDAMNTLGSQYPSLISSYDLAGNAIIDLLNAEEYLIETRKLASIAAREAALADLKVRRTLIEIIENIETLMSDAATGNLTRFAPDLEHGGSGAQNAFLLYNTDGKIISFNGGEELYHFDDEIYLGNQSFLGFFQRLLDMNMEDQGEEWEFLSKYKGENALKILSIEDFTFIKDYLLNNVLPKNDEEYQLNINDNGMGHYYDEQFNYFSGYGEVAFNNLKMFLELFDDLSTNRFNYGNTELEALLDEFLSKNAETLGILAPTGEYAEKNLWARQYFNWAAGDEEIDEETLREGWRKLLVLVKKYNKLVKTLNNLVTRAFALEEIDISIEELDLNAVRAEYISTGKIFTSLLTLELETAALEAHGISAADWSADYKTEFNVAKKDLSEELFLWINSLTDSLLESFIEDTSKLDSYLSIDSIINKYRIKDEKIIEGLLQLFIDDNQANKDRILKTIYEYDTNGHRFSILNTDLQGLSFFNEEKNIISGGGIARATTNKAMEIADLFDNNKIISKYADYFTTLLVDINRLVEDHYTEFATAKMNVLYNLAEKLGELTDNEELLANLFNIITAVDFSSYDSIVSGQENLLNYAELHNMTKDDINDLYLILVLAENNLLFNVNTLALEIINIITNASSNIDSILSTNKSGLDLNKALTEYQKILTKFTDLTFDNTFLYDALLGQYVYTVDGLKNAIQLEETNLNTRVEKLTKTADIYTKIITNKDNNFAVNGSDIEISDDAFVNKKVLWMALLLEGLIPLVAEEELAAVNEAYQLLANLYIDATEELDRNYLDFYRFILERAKTNDEDAQLALIQLENYNANKPNLYFKNIDWTKLALGTDYTGTNKFYLEKLAESLGMNVEATYQEILNAYLDKVYEDNPEGKRAALASINENIVSENINRYTTAINELLNSLTDGYFSVATLELLESIGLNGSYLNYNLDNAITAAEQFLNTLANSINGTTLTLELYNSTAKSILDKTLSQKSSGKSILDFASNTIDSSALESIANTFNFKINDLVEISTGEVKKEIGEYLSYNANTNTYDITSSFSDFIDALNSTFGTAIDKTSLLYVEALKSYNDKVLKQEHEIDQAITEELEKITSAKTGDRLNLALTYSLFTEDIWDKLLWDYAVEFKDGILEINDAADIPGALAAITSQVLAAGLLLPDELAKLNDALLSALSNITSILKNGITGNLSYSDKNTLESWASDYLITDLKFTQTANGFKLAQDSAIKLYNELKLIDSFLAKLVFDELNKSLQETNVHYKGISDIAARIKEIESIPSNVRTELYERELALAKEIYAVRSTTEDESFNFMSNKIPGGQNNPLNYWNNWNTAWQTIQESSESGFMDYTSFYNMITEMGNLAAKSGTEILLGGKKFIDGTKTAAELIEEGAGYLSVATDGSIQVDLSKFGADFLSGSADMLKGVDTGIHKLAHSQVEMLDGMILLMETVVAMENFDEISGEDKQIDLTDLFPDFTVDTDKLKLKQGAVDAFADMLSAKDDSDLGKALKAISWGGKNLKEWIVEAKDQGLNKENALAFTDVMNAFYQMYLSGDYSLDNIAASIKEVMAGTNFEGDLDIGDWHITVHNGVVLEKNDKGNYIVGDLEYNNPDTALLAIKASELTNILGTDREYTETGSVIYHGEIDTTVDYNVKQGLYIAHFSDGGSVSSNSKAGLAAAIENYSAMFNDKVGTDGTIETENTKVSYTMTTKENVVLNVEAEVIDGEWTINASLGSEIAGEGKLSPKKQKELETKAKTALNKTVTLTGEINTNVAYAAENPAVLAIEPNNLVLQTILDNLKFALSHAVVLKVITSSSSKYNDTVYQSKADRVNAAGNLAKAQGTLMGELGPELVVSNGRYFVVGQNGPEMIDLADDAIVFNHLQTKSLLEKGMSSGRGKVVTNERNAVSFATGNVNGGPAMADASSALAALKQLRAQWKALESLSVADLAKKGGGGGGGGGDDKAFLKELEKWYNWLQKIARLEKEINLEEAKRSKYLSDFKRSGQDFYISLVLTLEKLLQEAAVTKSLRDSQQEWFDKRRAEMNAEGNPFTALYTFDEQGQLKYKDGALEKLSYIWGTNNQGKANLSAQEQYEAIVAMDSRFAEFMKYDSSGQEIDLKDYAAMVQAFADKMDSDQTTMQNGWDSIQDLTKQGYELLTKSNELLHAIEDNLIEVENKVLNAIVESRQRAIDDAKKERDAIEEASNNLTNGLRDALDKERTMYENLLNADELATLQRRLGILLRSGGSASEIANLQQQITEKQLDTYFDLQELQIDAIELASEAELERLDNLIEIMQSTLDYEKEHGLLWNLVYQELTKSPEEISAFIQLNTSEYWGKSPTELNKVLTSDMFIIDQFKAMQSEAAKSIIGENYDSLDKLIAHYSEEMIDALALKETEEANAVAEASAAAAEGVEATNTGTETTSNDLNLKKLLWKAPYTIYGPGNTVVGSGYGIGSTKEEAEAVAKSLAEKKKAKLAQGGNANLFHYGDIKAKSYDIGGMVDQTGPAYLHAKEGVLTAAQTSILRNDILGNKPNSALSILSELRNQWIQMEQASYTPSSQSTGIIIENATVEMNVAQIANDYDARRAGEQALSEMMRIARKTAAQNRIG